MPGAFSLYCAYLLASGVAFVAAMVALTIRASTDAWREVIREIEFSPEFDGTHIYPFERFRFHYLIRIGCRKIFSDALRLLFLPCKRFKEHFFSVTLWYTRLALGTSLLFFIKVAIPVWTVHIAPFIWTVPRAPTYPTLIIPPLSSGDAVNKTLPAGRHAAEPGPAIELIRQQSE